MRAKHCGRHVNHIGFDNMQPKELFPMMDKDGLGAFLVSYKASHVQWSNFSVLGESNSKVFSWVMQVEDAKAETDAFAQFNPSSLCADLEPADSGWWELIVCISFQFLVWWYHTAAAAAAAAKSLQSCPTLCDHIDGSPPGSAVPGILQARILEWVAISFSNAWKWKVKVKSLSHVRLLAIPWTAVYQAPPSMGFSRQEYWSGVPSPSLWYHTSSF